MKIRNFCDFVTSCDKPLCHSKTLTKQELQWWCDSVISYLYSLKEYFYKKIYMSISRFLGHMITNSCNTSNHKGLAVTFGFTCDIYFWSHQSFFSNTPPW
jgi:hypothetical protein